MFYVAGRKVKVVTGKNTQTINICTETNLNGLYEYILRLRVSFVSEDTLYMKKFVSVMQLINFLKENYQAIIEKGPTGEVTPMSNRYRGSEVRQVKRNEPYTFRDELVNRYWAYQEKVFPQVEDYFERPFASDGRPPVFHKHKSFCNVIFNPDATQEEKNRLLHLLPEGEKHKWYRSMNSSQALAQSILGNLAVYNKLDILSELTDDLGESLFGDARVYSESFVMEYKVDYLGEPRPTSLDGFVPGKYQVAIECKMSESAVGACSRPDLRPSDSNYLTDLCNGTFTRQRGRKERCTLTEIGVQYWKYIPQLFKWQNDIDQIPCPVNMNYQLVRNILAACVRPGSDKLSKNGHAIFIYDDRNPAFQVGGRGIMAFEETQKGLIDPSLLRKCSWQRILNHLRSKFALPWLTEQLELKYGL